MPSDIEHSLMCVVEVECYCSLFVELGGKIKVEEDECVTRRWRGGGGGGGIEYKI